VSDVTLERWLPVAGWEGLYEVSDIGRVRSLDHWVEHPGWVPYLKRGRFLTPRFDSNGYLGVHLHVGERNKHPHIQKLVMEAFVGPRPEGLEICHNDCVRTNNVLSNLRYDTHSNNCLDGVRNGINPNARKTHCKYGHEFTPENTWRGSGGRRVCRACALPKLYASNKARRQRDPERVREQNRLGQARLRARRREAALATR
jgi:NUMOD4 motif/HNH endonuclease